MADDELESLEKRAHPFLIRAKKARLDCYWGNFAAPDEMHVMLVGKELGRFGLEGTRDSRATVEQISQIAADVSSKLLAAGFSESPVLLIKFQPEV